MKSSRDDMPAPTPNTRVDSSSDLSPAKAGDHSPVADGATADAELARYGLGTKDVDDTDD
jgi:hypothetical protein